MTRPMIAALALATSLASAGWAVAAEPDSSAPSVPSALSGPQVGAPAPAFELRTLAGKTVSLDSYRGKTLVINVWATWCPPCRQEMPDLISTAPKLIKSGVAVLGVDTTEDAPIVRAYVAAKGVPYPQAIDGDKAFTHAYDVQYFPTTYVVDPQGVLRARYIDVIAPAQLNALVAAANAGRDGRITSPLQTKIDATLTPEAFTFTGDASAIEANAKKADAAIASAEKMLDQSDTAKGNPTDLLRTRAEESALRDQAIAALSSPGVTVQDGALLPRLRGDAAFDRSQWQAAIDAYDAALAVDPKNEDVLSNLALSATRIENHDVAIAADEKLVALEPTDASALVELARAQASAGKNDDAYATFARAVDAASAGAAAHPADAKAVRLLAWTHLYFGRTYAKNGDDAMARGEFDRMLVESAKLPRGDARRDMYLEEGQEALVALGLDTHATGATVSLVPWTGADLPGSIPNTIKYRLVVAGSAGKNVNLKAADVPKGWVASFCSDRVCAPFKVSVAIPESGVKIVEFQLVPPTAKAAAPKVRVIGSDGAHESSATT